MASILDRLKSTAQQAVSTATNAVRTALPKLPYVNKPSANQSMTFQVGAGLSPEQKKRADEIISRQVDSQKREDKFVAEEKRVLPKLPMMPKVALPKLPYVKKPAESLAMKFEVGAGLSPEEKRRADAIIARQTTSQKTQDESRTFGQKVQSFPEEMKSGSSAELLKQGIVQELTPGYTGPKYEEAKVALDETAMNFAGMTEGIANAGGKAAKRVLPYVSGKAERAYTNKAARETLDSLKGSTEFEDGYAAFKKLMQRNPDYQNDAIDYAAFRDRLLSSGKYKNGQQIEDKFLSATRGGDLSNDELLQKFRERFQTEREIAQRKIDPTLNDNGVFEEPFPNREPSTSLALERPLDSTPQQNQTRTADILQTPSTMEDVRPISPRPQEFPYQKNSNEVIQPNLPGMESGVNPTRPPVVRGGIQPPELDFTQWKDKNPLRLIRETTERNLEDVAGKDAPKVKQFFTDRVKQNETQRIDFLNTQKEEAREVVVKGLGIKAGSKEDSLVQRYGEGLIDLNELKALTLKWERVVQASDYFRSKYDVLLDQINSVRKNFGYAPIPKRPDYFRHFQEIDNVIQQFGLILRQEELPTDISGMTDIFKPGKPFSTIEIARKNGPYKESALGGMNNYLDSISKQIFHIDSVQRGRALEKYIRDSAKDGTVKLPGFVANVREYTNQLAGKKANIDRAFMEYAFGRGAYGVMDAIKKRVGANMIGANISSAVTNFIPFTQAAATTDKAALAKGLYHAVSTAIRKDPQIIDGMSSGFLTRRLLADQVIDPTKFKKVEEFFSSIFRVIDSFTARSIVSGKYYEGIAKGLSKDAAMKAADDYAARVMADRSFGQTPNLFNVKTFGFLTQFQTEVNNMYSFIKKDIPRLSEGSKTKIASALLQLSVYSYIFNEMYEKVTGRRPTIDPIQAILTAAGQTEESKNRPVNERAVTAGKDIAGNLPFGDLILGAFDKTNQRSRIPVMSAIPDVVGLLSGKKDIIPELKSALFSLGLPFGGNQARKVFDAYQAMQKGGVEVNVEGRKGFEPIDSAPEALQAYIFGPYSITAEERSRLEQKDALMDKMKREAESLAPPDEPKSGMNPKDAGQFQAELQKAKDEEDINQASVKNKALRFDKELKENKSLTAQERLDRINELKKSDREVYDYFIDMVKREAKGIKTGELTKEEEQIKSLGVASRARAEFIHNQVLGKMPKSERAKYLIDLYKKEVVTKEVLKQLLEMPPLPDEVQGSSTPPGTPVSFLDRIGQLSARFESGSDPGRIGYDSTGGYSYGKYQLAHSNGLDFIRKSPFAEYFKGLRFNSSEWRKKWQEVAKMDPTGFAREQHAYILATHYKPQIDKLKEAGVDTNNLSQTIKDVIWSTAVQHGPSTSIVARAFKNVGKNASEADLIKEIYKLRWGGGTNFAKSTPDVKRSVYNRFFGKDGEMATALSRTA